MSTTTMSRRSFVATAAASGIAALGVAPAAHADEAVAPVSTMDAPAPVAEDQIAETYECDVLVVGAGVAGMSAARAATEAGAKVIVVEKASHPVCRGNFGCQFGAIDSSYQKAHGIEVDKRALVERFMRDTMQGANQFFVQYWADHSGETLDWCLAACDEVVELELNDRDASGLADGAVAVGFLPLAEGYDPSEERYPAFDTKHIIKDNNGELNEGGFSTMLAQFQAKTEAAGCQYLFDTFGLYLEKDNAAVTGLIAQRQDGTYIRVQAGSTILACGDFGSNMEMRELFAPQSAMLMSLFNSTDCNGAPTNTGDGHRMAIWAGAHMELGPLAPMAHLVSTNDVLIVNRKGERVGNEDLGAQSITDVIMRQPGRQVFVISGANKGPVVLDPGPFGVKNEEEYTDFGTMAAYIGEQCDPAVLQATVENYNAMCAAGEDTEYGKAEKYMVALEEPYFVCPSGPGNMLVIMGGIACDNNCQALDDDDVAIPGMFVAGNTQGGRFGAEYPMTAPGISHGIAFTLGKYVGERVVELASA